MTRPLLLTSIAVAAALHGCACDSVPDAAVESCEQSAVFAGSVKTDILFVIDDSGSMREEQVRLRDALGRFIDTLDASPISDDFQIGVTTTAVRAFDGGTTYPATRPSNDACAPLPVPYPSGTPYAAGRLVAIDPATVDPNAPIPAAPNQCDVWRYWGDFLWSGTQFTGNRILGAGSPTLVDDFKRNVLVWTLGSSREQPFEAMKLALSDAMTGPGGANAGFLRPGARLAVIFLSDEDDCSGPTDPSVTNSTDCATQRTATPSALTPVQDYVDLLRGPIGGEVRDVVVGAVVGVTCSGGICTNTRCPDAYTDPPADRFLELLSAFDPAKTTLASMCDSNFDAALDQFANAVMSQTMPLVGAVADPAMLVVSVRKPTGTVACSVGTVGTPAAATADAVYSPPAGGKGATLTFQHDCALAPGDRVEVHVICAG